MPYLLSPPCTNGLHTECDEDWCLCTCHPDREDDETENLTVKPHEFDLDEADVLLIMRALETHHADMNYGQPTDHRVGETRHAKKLRKRLLRELDNASLS